MKKKINMKLLAAVISASMITGALPCTAAGAETTENTVVSVTTSASASAEILTNSGAETITFSETGITASGSGISISEENGCRIAEISANGIYTLSGEGSLSGISVKKGLTVTLEFEDLSIDNSENEDLKFIDAGKGSEVNMVLNGNLTVKGGKNAVKGGENTIISIDGDGSFVSEGAKDDGIKVKNGTVNICGGTVSITECEGDGIQAENVEISGGTLNIDTWYQEAATSYYSSDRYSEGSDTSLNYLWESGDTVKYERVNVDTGSHKGIKAGTKAKTISFADGTDDIIQEASGSLKISGGDVNVDTTKSGLKANSLSSSGYSAANSGTYLIGSPDDGIACNNDMEITGGNILISSADDGISSAGELTITGNTEITIETAYEGIEAKKVTTGKSDGSDNPVITINSTDDGINTSGKTLTYTYDSYSGYETDDEINYTKKSISSATGNNITVNSGTITINIDSEGTKTASLPDGSLNKTKSVTFRSSGDGIDCNGSLTQNGGELYIYGQTSGDNSPVDTNSGYTFNSGSKILAAGADGMNECSPEGGTGSYITYGSRNSSAMPGNDFNNGGNPPEMPGNDSISGNAPGMPGNGNNNGSNPPEMPGNDNNNGGNPPEMPGNDNNNGGNPPEMPGNDNNNGGNPPEMPGNGNSSGGNPPEMPGNGSISGNFQEMPGNDNNNGGNFQEMPGNGDNAGSFSAGQYWAVLDSDNTVVDYGKLKYSGSFILYGSDLISDGAYTLTVTDSEPENGDYIEVSATNNGYDNFPTGNNSTISGNYPPAENNNTISGNYPPAGPWDNVSGNNPPAGPWNNVSGNEPPVIPGTLPANNNAAGSTVSKNIITGSFTIGDYSYEYSYSDSVSYNGKKQSPDEFTINGKSEGNTLSGNVIFRTVKYKNNKAVGEAKAIPLFKAAKGADTSVRKAVREINRYFKKNPLLFNITKGTLDESMISGSAVYNSKSGKWKFDLRQQNQDGSLTKLKYKTNGKGDFTPETSTFDSSGNMVTIKGINNYTGEASIPVTVK